MIELVALAYITWADLRVIDGDTTNCNGKNMRLLGDGAPLFPGVDVAEISRAKCEQQKRLGHDAKKAAAATRQTPGLKIAARDSRLQSRPCLHLCDALRGPLPLD